MVSTNYEMMAKRKSFHLFRDIGNLKISSSELEDIKEEYLNLEPLNASIKTAIQILPESKTTCKRGSEYVILFYSEKKDHYLSNIGYLGEQLDLWLVSRNIGTLWFGIGRPLDNKDRKYQGLDFVICLLISKVDEASKFRKDMTASKRKTIEEIWEGPTINGVSERIRFAPSACNLQPWFIKNSGKELSVYLYTEPGKRGIMPVNKVSFYHQIDLGIFLCFLDLCLKHENIPYQRELMKSEETNEARKLFAIYKLN